MSLFEQIVENTHFSGTETTDLDMGDLANPSKKQKATGDLMLSNKCTLPKPEGLVEFIPLAPLTLLDRRLLNVLLHLRWPVIDQDIEHCVQLADIRRIMASYCSDEELSPGPHNSNDRIYNSVVRLMGTVVRLKVPSANGKTKRMMQAPLIGPNRAEEDAMGNGTLKFTIPPLIRKILINSDIFGRLRMDLMFRFESKYSLALYELLAIRRNLKHKNSHMFPLGELRGILGVPADKLEEFGNFKQRVLVPAAVEVSEKSDIAVTFEVRKTGRKVTGVTFRWTAKPNANLTLEPSETHGSVLPSSVRFEANKVDPKALNWARHFFTCSNGLPHRSRWYNRAVEKGYPPLKFEFMAKDQIEEWIPFVAEEVHKEYADM